MKPYQVRLFPEEAGLPSDVPDEPFFFIEEKRYLNFARYDFRNLHNNEYVKEQIKSHIEEYGFNTGQEGIDELRSAMRGFKKVDELLFFPDEVTAVVALASVFDAKTTYFLDFETHPAFPSVLQPRGVEYYDHRDQEQLSKLLRTHAEKVLVIDGLYEWLGTLGPVNELVKLAREHGAVVVANEINTFGLLGRNGRGFVDLFNIYEDVNFEIGSWRRFYGGFGAYLAAKKYLINKVEENQRGLLEPLPRFMYRANLAGLELLQDDRITRTIVQRLWKESRYFINRVKQMGLVTASDTPVIVINFNNNDERAEFGRRLYEYGIIAGQWKERLRFMLAVEHTREDIDYCLDRIETVKQDLAIT